MAELTTPTYQIRYATEKDIPTILQLIQELASYERALHEVLATEQTLFDTLSFPTSSDPKVREKGGFAKTLVVIPTSTETEAAADAAPREQIAGMALYFNNYSTWLAKPGIYLEDLYVRPNFRGRGYGKALLRALARECVSNGWGRLEWSVLRWNTPSIEFYESAGVGALSNRDEWEGMRVSGDALRKLAEGS